MTHQFICPNCGHRSISAERTAGFRNQAKTCSKCGFAFLFELLDDYYPAPNAAFFVCDQEGRIIGCGRGSRELTGLSEEKVIGRPVQEVLGLEFEGEQDHVERIRRIGCPRNSEIEPIIEPESERCSTEGYGQVTMLKINQADFFPIFAYDFGGDTDNRAMIRNRMDNH